MLIINTLLVGCTDQDIKDINIEDCKQIPILGAYKEVLRKNDLPEQFAVIIGKEEYTVQLLIVEKREIFEQEKDKIRNEFCNHKLDDLIDYKFYCFNGKPEYCQVLANRETNLTIDFYDMDWNHMNFTGLHLPEKPYPHAKQLQKRPDKFEKMKQLAEILAKGKKFVRIDFYNINRKIYFGEITFYPASGFGEFKPEKWNYILGEKIKLK